jgi:TolA-binding protein
MDMNAILSALPALGPIGIVLIILGYVARQWISSDARYRREIDRLIEAHAKELERVNSAHDQELQELRNDIRDLRADISELRKELEDERRLRYEAQEEAHQARLLIAKEKWNVSE